MNYCAIDFGTSNSALAIPASRTPEGAGAPGMTLVPLEGEHRTMPTAVFYFAETQAPLPAGAEPPRAFGRAALQAYVEGHEGRLMRSMKSLLGSQLIEQMTDVGAGRSVRYLDVITGYLRHLKACGENAGSRPLTQLVLGRPVFFVDEDAQRDQAAQNALEAAARAVGFQDITFQYEPIAAALDYEQQAVAQGVQEERVLVVDIGGGTSDFSVVRVGAACANRIERRDDILANHGVHVAGTDFDRRVALARLMPLLGYRSLGPSRGGQPPREVPNAVYFDLSTWHLINSIYQPQRVSELKSMASFYAEAALHRRLMRVVTERLGHEMLGHAEAAKIAVAAGGTHEAELSLVERGLRAEVSEAQALEAIDTDLQRIVAAAQETVRLAGLAPRDVDALYFTGGSTGLRLLTQRLAEAFPQARAVRGDRLASVASGLGLHASRCFGPVPH